MENLKPNFLRRLNMIHISTPPHLPKVRKHAFSGKALFLAGSIDQGKSEMWQDKAIELLQEHFKHYSEDVFIYNPRRADWDSKWSHEFTDPQLFQQMAWELDMMEEADHIIMNILPDSKSPITLLELGLHAKSDKLRVVCPKEFYRSGNVHMVCYRNNIPVYDTLEECIQSI